MRKARRRSDRQATTTHRHHHRWRRNASNHGQIGESGHTAPIPGTTPNERISIGSGHPAPRPPLRPRPSAASRTLSKSPCQIAVRRLRNWRICRDFRVAEGAISGHPYRKVRSPRAYSSERSLRSAICRRFPLFGRRTFPKSKGTFPQSSTHGPNTARGRAPPPTTRRELHGRLRSACTSSSGACPARGLGLVVVRSHPAHSCPPAPRRLLSRRDPSTGTVGCAHRCRHQAAASGGSCDVTCAKRRRRAAWRGSRRGGQTRTRCSHRGRHLKCQAMHVRRRRSRPGGSSSATMSGPSQHTLP